MAGTQPSFDIAPADPVGKRGRGRGRGGRKRELNGLPRKEDPLDPPIPLVPSVFVPTPSPVGSMAHRLAMAPKAAPRVTPELVLIRGPPGSGKTTTASFFVRKGYRSMCTDDYFMVYNPETKQKEYQFDESKLVEYHKRCLEQTKTLLRCGYNVVVHNTFRTYEETGYYLRLKELMGVNVTVLRMNSQFKSTHNIPEERLKEYKTRIERIDGEKKVRYDMEKNQLIYTYIVPQDPEECNA